MGSEDTKKDYVPLTIDYQERLYAGGRIKGSRWVKREGRATDAEVLSGRVIDRSLRPLFPKNLRRDLQLIVTVLSVDHINDPEILGVIASSAALSISPIPWAGPIGAVRVGLQDGTPVINPENESPALSQLDLVVSASKDLVVMIEAGAAQVPEDQVLAAIEAGFTASRPVIDLITDLVKVVGQDKISLPKIEVNPALRSQINKTTKPLVEDYIKTYSTKEGGNLRDIIASVSENLEDRDKSLVPEIIEDLFYQTIRNLIIKTHLRADGRKLDQIRPLSAEVAILPRVHGSALFQRGQTQVLTVATLGAPSLSQSLETAEGEDTKRYMHHYNFPPFSTGETGRIGAPGRREIGHGALAEKALIPVIPPETSFPYAIRMVSEVMSSNGSTSMASTCGSTLALMDAGVPIISPVAGISIGLVDDQLLTDIIGMEDHYGDMDFKVAGTDTGITAIQLDVKVPGITLPIIKQTLQAAKIARKEILALITATIPEPRSQLSAYAPKISTVTIPVDKIGELIGPGGKIIKKLMADTDTDIDVRDDGSVFVTGLDQDKVNAALTWISSLGREAAPGEIYDGTVARIQPFGAFVNILPGKDGLVHVSQMSSGFVNDPNQIVKVGDVVKVWVTEIDSQGRINLSMLFDAEGHPVVKARDTAPRRQPGYFSSAPSRGPRH
jgi:polyribonucleotide nucleotidyltransferase